MFGLRRMAMRFGILLLIMLLCAGCSPQKKENGQAMATDAPKTIDRELSAT